MNSTLLNIIAGAMLIAALVSGLSFFADISGNPMKGELDKQATYLLLLCMFISVIALIVHRISKPKDCIHPEQ